MTRLSLVLFLFIISNSCRKAAVKGTAACTNAEAPVHAKGAQIRNLINDYVKKGLPGISVLTGDKNGVWYGAAGKADIEHNIDYTPCTVQKLGSITKMMMGVLTMKLVEEKKVNLDDPISRWIDAKIIRNIKNADKVTLRNCMQHTTGIYDIINSSGFYLAILNNPNKHWTSEELLTFAENQPADFEANAKASYSNTNYIFVAMCLEKITGLKHEDLLREKIFVPLAMNDTYYNWHDGLPDITAQGYYDIYNTNTLINVSNFVTGNGNGFTGVYSNVFDLQKFVKGVFIDKTVLSQSTLDTMMQWKYVGDNAYFGLGLFKFISYGPRATKIGHTGGDLGYACEVYYFPYSNNYYIACVNYGTTTDSFLSPLYWEFIGKLESIVRN